MSDAYASNSVLHVDHAEANRLAWAFGISLAIHILVAGTWYSGHKLGLWEKIHMPRWMEKSRLVPAFLKPPQPPREVAQAEPPLMFVEVSPAQAVTEPPKNAKYYSDKNSVAANPTADRETDTPKIEGRQKQVPKTIDTPRQEFVPLAPAVPAPPAPVAKPQEEEKAQPTKAPGDLAFAKPDPNPTPDTGDKPRTRPRTIKEALARQNIAVPGEKMQQEGGVRRRLELSSLDTVATPFGAYDAAMVSAISQRWYTLLDQRSYASDARGKVVLNFVLHQDGRISEMKVAESSAGEVLSLICQKAVLDPAPFAPWPGDMRRLLGETRKIQFTFYYN